MHCRFFPVRHLHITAFPVHTIIADTADPAAHVFPRALQIHEMRSNIMWDKIALILLVIGGINWGLVGIFELDLVAWMFGGAASVVSRMIYILVAISAVWCISFLFRDRIPAHAET